MSRELRSGVLNDSAFLLKKGKEREDRVWRGLAILATFQVFQSQDAPGKVKGRQSMNEHGAKGMKNG